jgi:hypothetical protein
MKRNLIYSSILVALFGLSSCNDWLEVRPKSQIPADLHFSREAGYFDQLTGIYTRMSEGEMYGREMTFGLMEVLSQVYDIHAIGAYRDAAQYNYMSSVVRPIIDRIWVNTYNCIANLNVMLEYLEKVDPGIFRDNNRNLIKGEAIGLRAFLHFDLLRIFAPSYAANPGAMAIPYVEEYAPFITRQSTVSQVLDLIIRDLEQAVILLENDPLTGTTEAGTKWAAERRGIDQSSLRSHFLINVPRDGVFTPRE